MSLFDEEDNNPFSGLSHLFALGIEGVQASHGLLYGSEFGLREELESGDEEDNIHQHTISTTETGEETHINLSPSLGPDEHHRDVSSLDSVPHHQANNSIAESLNNGSNGTNSSYPLLSDSVVDLSKQQEYERSLIDQAATNTPPELTSSTAATLLTLLSPFPPPQIEIPYVIQLKDRRGRLIIVYIIKIGSIEVRRRYSDFDRLRSALVRIYPTFVLPSLPSKHSFLSYVKSPMNVQKSDPLFIEHRKRGLRDFLNRAITYSHYNPLIPEELPPLRLNDVFIRFLDPDVTDFGEVTRLLPSKGIVGNPLLSHPLNPYRVSPFHSLLPPISPHAAGNHDSAVRSYVSVIARETRARNEIPEPPAEADGFEIDAAVDIIDFSDMEEFKKAEKYVSAFSKALKPLVERLNSLLKTLNLVVNNLSKLGAYFNAFSLEYAFTMSFEPEYEKQVEENNEQAHTLASGIEKIGQLIDNEFLNIEMLQHQIETAFSEQLSELNQMLKNALSETARFKKLKDLQYLTVNKRLREKRKQLKNVLDVDTRYQKLQEVLRNNAGESHTIKQAYQRLEFQKQQQILKLRKSSASISTTHDMSDLESVALEDEVVSFPSSSFSWLHLFTGKVQHPEQMSRDQRALEIRKLKKEILSLQQLARVVAEDVKDVGDSLKVNIKTLCNYMKNEVVKLNLKFTRVLLKFFRENLRHWEKVNEHIEENVYNLRFSIRYDDRIPRYIRNPASDVPESIATEQSSQRSSKQVPKDVLEHQISKHNATVSTALVNHVDPQEASKGYLDGDETDEEKDDTDEGEETEGDDTTFGALDDAQWG